MTGECFIVARYITGDVSAVTQGLTDLGRFAEPSLFILVSLSEGPKHGYAIMTDVEAISGVPLGPGTLYGALARLESRGLIEALEPEDRRRPYRLTGLGVTTLRAQLEQMRGHRPRRPRASGRQGHVTPAAAQVRTHEPEISERCPPRAARVPLERCSRRRR